MKNNINWDNYWKSNYCKIKEDRINNLQLKKIPMKKPKQSSIQIKKADQPSLARTLSLSQ